jgi:hypothetical protein
MKSIKNIFIIAFTLLLLVTNVYAGGGNRTGTGGAAQLLIPVGARGISMGLSNISSTSGVEALYWNPAGAAKMNNSAAATFSHMNYIADIGVEYGAVSANFQNFGILSLSLKSLSVGDILVTTTRDPDGTGKTFSPQMMTAGLTYSRQLTDQVAVGMTVNYVTETLDQVSASTIAFNVGLMYDNLASVKGLAFGIVLKNLGPKMQYDGSGLLIEADAASLTRSPQYYKISSAPFELPTSFELGFSFKPVIDQMNSLLASATFQNNNFSGDEYKLGLEYGYNNLFFVRGGYDLSPKNQTDEYIYGFTAGAGINYDMEGISIKVDYAYRDVKYFDANHIFQISLGF